MASTSVPDRNGDPVRSSTGNTTAPMTDPLDDMMTGNVRGTSPVSGLEGHVRWERSGIHPSSMDNCGSPTGAATASLGSWPIRNYGNNPRQKSNSGEGPADWTGHHPGSVD